MQIVVILSALCLGILLLSKRARERLQRGIANYGIPFARKLAACIDSVVGHGTFRKLLWYYGSVTNRLASADYFTVEHFIKVAEQRSGLKANFDEYERLAIEDGTGSKTGGMPRLFKELVEDFNRKQDTVVLPYSIIKEQLVRWIMHRMYLNNHIIKNPQIKNIPIRRPLIITGLWRTGTTMLYNLISQDPKSRSPQLWEIQKPIPPPERATYKTDPRIQDVNRDVSAVEFLTAGEHKKIHDLVADAPEECAFILFMDCLVFNHLLHDRLPNYRNFLRNEHDIQGSYYFLKRFLQVLASTYPPEDHFTLKSPYPHMYHLDTLLKTFPDACVVVCHRDPVKCVPSMMSLNSVFSKAFWKDFDPVANSHLLLEQLAEGTDNSMKFRDTLAPEYDRAHFFDCRFDEFVKNPVAMVKRIYDHFEYEYTPEFESTIKGYVEELDKERQASRKEIQKHDYTLQSFGLTEQEVRNAFGMYYSRYYPEKKQ